MNDVFLDLIVMYVLMYHGNGCQSTGKQAKGIPQSVFRSQVCMGTSFFPWHVQVRAEKVNSHVITDFSRVVVNIM